MSHSGKLALGLAVLIATVAATDPARADEHDGARTDTVTLGTSGQTDGGSGTVNLQGFAQPIAPGALGPTPVQTTMINLGGVNVGALSEFGSSPGDRPNPNLPTLAGRGDSQVIGGYAGYRFTSDGNPRSGYGVNLRVGTDPVSSSDNWRVQPGFDFATSLGSSWRFNSRLFSTYNLEGTSAGSRSSFSGGEERGFRDIGLSLGLGYAPSESWTVQTQATYAMPLRGQDKTGSGDEGESSNEFFGGVILNYRF